MTVADELGARVVPFSDVLVYQDQIARLWKRVELAEEQLEQHAAFIGHKGLGDEFTAWALARRAEIDRLLAETAE